MVSPAVKQSGASVLLSLGIHLVLLMMLSVLLFTVQHRESMLLSFLPVTQAEDLETEVGMSLNFESELETLSTSFSEIEREPVEPLPLVDGILLLAETVSQNTSSVSLTAGSGSGQETLNPKNSGAGFFGIEATGNRVVYVIDMSPSMEVGRYQRRYDRAVEEVLSSINQLRSEQEFYVYLFCFRKFEMKIGNRQGQFCPPTNRNQIELAKWLKGMSLGPGTDPREALVAALKQKPTCVFLLSDGAFNGMAFRTGKYGGRSSTVELARRYNKSESPIHTIGLEDEINQADMTQIAKESGGTYRFVSAEFGPE